MRPTILVSLVAALLLAGSASALDYWPDSLDRLIYRYESKDNGWAYDSVFEVAGESQTMAWVTGICHGSEHYTVDEKGVGLVGWYSYCAGGIDPGFGYIACWSTQFIDYWLDRDLGPVRINSWELVSIGESVATEAQTWSEVKALYR